MRGHPLQARGHFSFHYQMSKSIQEVPFWAAALHSGEFRHDGVTPYVRHCADVAGRVYDRYRRKWSNEQLDIAMQISWLHDAVEHGRCTLDDLTSEGLHPDVINGISLLTRRQEHSYDGYVQRLATDEVARGVKICDILSNMADDPSDSMLRRYASALLVLLAHERHHDVERDLGPAPDDSGASPTG